MDYVYRKYAEKMQKGTVNRNKNCPSAKDLERFVYSEMVKRRQRLGQLTTNCQKNFVGSAASRALICSEAVKRNFCSAQGGQSRLTYEAAVKRKISID